MQIPGNFFGQLLRARRAGMELSLRELGEKVDKSAAYLSDIEAGNRNPPKDLIPFAKHLELSMPYLEAAAGRWPSATPMVMAPNEFGVRFEAFWT